MKHKFKKISLLLFYLVLPITTFAQQGPGTNPTGGVGTDPASPQTDPVPLILLENPIGADSINEFILVVLEGAIKIGIPIIVLAIIYSGFLFVAAQGNTEKLSQAKKSLMYTIIGSAILLGSYAIAQLITDTVRSL